MTTTTDSPATEIRFAPLANVALVLALLYSALPFLTYGLAVIFYPYQVDYMEGPILDQVVRLSRFENIFTIPTATGPFTVGNYPPVFQLVQVPFAWAAGPALWYGRAVSWAAAAATALLIAATIYTLTRDRMAAAVSGLVFVSVPYVAMWAPLDRIDCLALALTWSALFVVVRWPEARWTLAAAAALFTAAAFTRQTSLLAGPLAAFVLLVGLGHRRRAVLLGVLTAAACGVVALALNLSTRGGFLFGIVLADVNPLALEPLKQAAQDLLNYMALLVACAAALFALDKAQHVRWFLLPYALGAAAVTITIMKVGSNANYLLELCAALSACAGYLVSTFRTRGIAMRTVLTTALVVQALLLSVWWHRVYAPRLTGGLSNPGVHKGIQNFVAQTDGQILLEEDMAALPLCGKRVVFLPFEMTQLSNGGLWDQSAFVRSIEAKQYAAIITTDLYTSQRWTREMKVAIAKNYVAAESAAGRILFVPDPASTGPGT